ncbi:MAG TPA: ABC transporter ATP-binding protein [Pyrinomonadaceae bacterium]|nr:ABC transporter ATP-binding protein [Pyrinomonadaceae bacterium]
MTDKLVEVREVKKSYGPTLAVAGVTLEIRAGEIYALVGANGAGKSTLIRMITGITYPDEGSVEVCGEDTRRGVRAKRHLGYLPEELTFYERLSGREYLRLVAGLRGAEGHQVDEALDFFELKSVADKWVGGYSLGMRKKLGLAAAMINDPQVLVLDEPLNGLDVEMMRKLRARLEGRKQSGRSVLVSSHYMDFVERIADRVGIMSRGRLVAESSPGKLREQAGLRDASFEDVFFNLAR